MTCCPPIEALERPTAEVALHAAYCRACRTILALISGRLLDEKPTKSTLRRMVIKP